MSLRHGFMPNEEAASEYASYRFIGHPRVAYGISFGHSKRSSKPKTPVDEVRAEVRAAEHRAEYSASDINRKLDEVEKQLIDKEARIKQLETVVRTAKRLYPHDCELKQLIQQANISA